jgi:hypothetical protein
MKLYLTEEQKSQIDNYYPSAEERKQICESAQKAGIIVINNSQIIALARTSLAFDFICENEKKFLTSFARASERNLP